MQSLHKSKQVLQPSLVAPNETGDGQYNQTISDINTIDNIQNDNIKTTGVSLLNGSDWQAATVNETGTNKNKQTFTAEFFTNTTTTPIGNLTNITEVIQGLDDQNGNPINASLTLTFASNATGNVMSAIGTVTGTFNGTPFQTSYAVVSSSLANGNSLTIQTLQIQGYVNGEPFILNVNGSTTNGTPAYTSSVSYPPTLSIPSL